MSLYTLLFIAVIQGLTEFLPVSSSGHLAIFSTLLGADTTNLLLYSLVVHGGTACAAVWFFRSQIKGILLGLLDFIQKKNTLQSAYALKWTLLVFAVSLPTAVGGLLWKDYFENLSHIPYAIPSALLVTGSILLITKFIPKKNLSLKKFNFTKAFIVGIAQTLALTPGISRSGMTIGTALILGAKPMFAGRLSFLASLVAIFGALLLEIIDTIQEQSLTIPISYLVLSFFTAFFVGLWALKFLIKILNHGKIYIFSLYCFLLSLALFIATALGYFIVH